MVLRISVTPGFLLPLQPLKRPSFFIEHPQYLTWVTPNALIKWWLEATSASHVMTFNARTSSDWSAIHYITDLDSESTASALFDATSVWPGLYRMTFNVYGLAQVCGFQMQETAPPWYSKPTAAFSASPLTGTNPLDVQFIDESLWGPTSWYWDFGDGETSTEKNPLHTYSDAGSYRVMLEASNGAGSDTLTKFDYVVVSRGINRISPLWTMQIGPL